MSKIKRCTCRGGFRVRPGPNLTLSSCPRDSDAGTMADFQQRAARNQSLFRPSAFNSGQMLEKAPEVALSATFRRLKRGINP